MHHSLYNPKTSLFYNIYKCNYKTRKAKSTAGDMQLCMHKHSDWLGSL